jgi:predicted GTPase
MQSLAVKIEKQSGFENLKNSIYNNSEISLEEKDEILSKLHKLEFKKANVLIAGATGVGKSTTINDIFGISTDSAELRAEIGYDVAPKTKEISKFQIGNLILWDSPGLGDEVDEDKRHKEKLIAKLKECDENGDFVIDLVLVLVDGSNKDMGSTFELINNVIIPNVSDAEKRVVVGINKIDKLLHPLYEHWDRVNGVPKTLELENRILEKENSVQNRIFNSTHIKVSTVSFSAGWTDEKTNQQDRPYNILKLLCFLSEKMPDEKRVQMLFETRLYSQSSPINTSYSDSENNSKETDEYSVPTQRNQLKNYNNDTKPYIENDADFRRTETTIYNQNTTIINNSIQQYMGSNDNKDDYEKTIETHVEKSLGQRVLGFIKKIGAAIFNGTIGALIGKLI